MSDDLDTTRYDTERVDCKKCGTCYEITIRTNLNGNSWNERESIECQVCAQSGERTVVWSDKCFSASATIVSTPDALRPRNGISK